MIKEIIQCYRLGKHLRNNVGSFENFEIKYGEDGDIFLTKEMAMSEIYLGTIHSLCYTIKDKWHEVSVLIKKK